MYSCYRQWSSRSCFFLLQRGPFEHLGSKRRENRQEIKAKKAAQMAAADDMAREIFKRQYVHECTTCADVRRQLKHVNKEHEDVKRVMEDEMEEMKDKVEDLAAALQAKKLVIRNLEEEVEKVQKENRNFKEEADRLRQQLVNNGSQQGKLYNNI